MAVEDAGTGNAGPPVAALRVGDVVDLGLHQRVGGRARGLISKTTVSITTQRNVQHIMKG